MQGGIEPSEKSSSHSLLSFVDILVKFKQIWEFVPHCALKCIFSHKVKGVGFTMDRFVMNTQSAKKDTVIGSLPLVKSRAVNSLFREFAVTVP